MTTPSEFHFTLAPGWVDSHCHLTKLSALEAVFTRATAKGIGNFCMGGIGPEDWQEQIKILGRYSEGVLPCFGLHPYWISAHSPNQCETALETLETRLSGSLGIGEMGLDFRAEIVHGNPLHQTHFFVSQLHLAKKHSKVPVLHIVRAHAEAARILREFGGHGRSALVHAFNSGKEIAKTYLDFGYYLSIGGPLLRKNNRSLQEAVAYCPIERICLESDSPDQAPPGIVAGENEPWTILLVAERLAELKGLTQTAVLEQARKNFLKLFDQELDS